MREASYLHRRVCSGCRTALPRLELVTDEGQNHVTGESWFRCRKCVLERGAQAALLIAKQWVEGTPEDGRCDCSEQAERIMGLA